MSCTLCDLPTPDPPVTEADVPGEYCCRGCLEVARTLEEPAEADAETAADALDRGADSTDATGETAYLSVSGMHCATCEAFVESRATDHEGVAAAAASYPTDAVKLTYDPDRVDREALPELIDGLGYEASEREPGADAEADDDLARLLIGGFFGMMTMLWYVLFLYPAYLGVPESALLLDLSGAAGSYLLANVWVMTSIVLGYTGYPVFRGAYVSLRAGHPNMDLLVGLAAGTAYLYSTTAILLGRTEVYFDVACVIVLAVTVGNYYEDRLKRRAAGRLSDLTAERVSHARKRTHGPNEEDGTATAESVEGPTTAESVESVPVEDLDPGDEVVVTAGERVPVDGTVVEGSAAVDESLVTGESRPLDKQAGDEAIGGSVLTDGRLVVAVDDRATSTLDRIVDVLWDIQSSRPGAQRLADRIAAAFVPLVVVLAVGATGWHLLSGATATAALLTGLSVLVVSCPCALGLATPLAVARGIREAVASGIVVTDASTFDDAPEADVVAFDKTGTLTTGEMAVVECVGDEAVGRRAAAVEQYADHPIASAIVDQAPAPGATVADFERHPASGVSGLVTESRTDAGTERADGGPPTDAVDHLTETADRQTGSDRSTGSNRSTGSDRATGSDPLDGERVVVGRESLFSERDWHVPEEFGTRAAEARVNGHVAALVGWRGRARGVVVAGDEPRAEWREVVSALGADRRVAVITGDESAAADAFREHPAVDDVFAGVPPEGKAAVVDRLRGEGTVAMIGDGVNDAPALAAADTAIALDHTALAADAADAVVTTEDLRAVPRVFELTRRTNRRITQNLGWAFLYNAIALPLALAGVLNPLFAAVAMAVSSLLVVANSSRSLLDADDERALAADAASSTT